MIRLEVHVHNKYIEIYYTFLVFCNTPREVITSYYMYHGTKCKKEKYFNVHLQEEIKTVYIESWYAMVMYPYCHPEVIVLSGVEADSNKQQLRGRSKIHNYLLYSINLT